MKAGLNLRTNVVGMTLLEIIIVVALLGTLGVYLIANLTDTADQAKIDQTKIGMGNVRQALQLYRLHLKNYPSTADGLTALLESTGDKRWRGPYLDNQNKIIDPWDMEFEYESNGRDYKIISAGPDQQLGTEDDITYPEEAAGGESAEEE